MPRKKKAAVSRTPVTSANLLGQNLGETEYRGGIRRPAIITASADVDKARRARLAAGGGLGVGAPATRQAAAGTRTAGMLIDNVQTSRAFLSGYALEAYRTSFANGLNNRSGTYDVPGYFVQMNQLNGGILYWPVTLQEKYQWFRYFCYFLDDKHLGQVLMANGTQKSIKDIQVGDEVITGQGTIRRVAEKIERQCSDPKAVEIGVWCLQNTSLVTHEHPFYILRRNKVKKNESHYRDSIDFSPEWVEAEKIEVGDYVLMSPYKPEKQSNLTKDEASFLGYYASEGSLTWGLRCTSTVGDEGEKKASGWKWHQEKVKVPTGVTFTLHKDEENTIGKSIINLCLRVFNVEAKIIRRRNNTIEIGVSSRIIGEFCHLHVGCGSIDKSLSKDLLDASTESKKAFLLAYAEGDGHQYLDGSNKGKLLIATASESLASQVQVLAISAGVMCRIAKYERKNDKWSNNPIWHVTIPSWCADLLVASSSKWEESDSCGDKHCALFVNGYAAFKVEHVAYMEREGTVYNLELDAQGDEKSFICNGMIAHNCRTEPYVGRAMDLLTDLPMSKLTLNMPKMKGKEKLRQEILDFYQYQVEKIGLFEICQNILYEMNCIGNCFKGDTLITTSLGVVPISEIRSGDFILSAEGQYERVSEIARRMVSERLVSLDIAGLRGVDFSPTSEHPVFILRDGDKKMVLAREVVIGDYIGVGGLSISIDIQSKDWFNELARSEYLQSYYDSVEIGDRHVIGRFKTPVGTQETAEVVKKALIAWIATLSAPVDMTCEELASKLAVCGADKLRSVAYFLRKRGVIKSETISLGRKGKSIRWYPSSNEYDPNSLYGINRMVEMDSIIGDLEVDNDFMYLLGYWLGDGWLWKYDHNRVKPYVAFDICIDPDADAFIRRVSETAKKVFGDEAVTTGKGLFGDNEKMFHVVVEDPLLCMWWSENFGDNCETKRIPKWVMEMPPEKLIWMLRGMIDSDGCVAKISSGCEASVFNTNRGLMQQLFHVGLKCGIPFRWGVSKEKPTKMPQGNYQVGKKCFSLKIATRGYYEKLTAGALKYVLPEWSETPVVNSYFCQLDGQFYYRVDGISNPHFSGYVYNFEVEGSHTYCANGVRTHNCFLFHEFSEKTQMWERVVMLPPEEVYVFQLPFSDNKRVEYRPERLMALLKSDGKEMVLGQAGLSEDIVRHIPEEIAEMVRNEGCIVMDSDPMTGSFVAHIARRKHPYMDLGASILERVLVPLLQKENYRYTQLSLANRNMTPKNVINAVGLLQEELDDLRTQVDLSYLDPDYSIITNYEVTWNQIGAQDRILNLDSEYQRIEDQIFAAMGVTRELLTGEGSYSGNKITVEILNTMFLLTRETLKNYIERQLFMPLAERHGWFEVGAFGAKKYWYPQISFNRLTIRDNNEVFESLFQLYQKGSLNVDIIYELFNLNSDEVRDKLLQDAFTVKDPTFNRLLEEVHAEVGRNFSQTTNVLERIVAGLGLKITNPPNVPQGQEGEAAGGFGGGFGAPAETSTEAPVDEGSEPLALFPGDTPVPAGAQGPQGLTKKPSIDEVADAVAESLPPEADEKDVKDVVDGLQPRRSKKPSLEDIADAVAESIPASASDEEISDIVDRVSK